MEADLIPELCTKFTIPARSVLALHSSAYLFSPGISTLHTALLLPSVMRRIDDFLLVKELNAKLFKHAIEDEFLHMAVCTRSAGLEYDYERLEFLGISPVLADFPRLTPFSKLGDSFLKYLSTIYVFFANPTLGEGALHTKRQQLISNKSLFENAGRKGLTPYIQSKPFAPKSWHPPNFVIRATEKGKSVNTQETGERDFSLSTQAPSSAPSDPTPASKSKSKKEKRRSGEDIQWLGDKVSAHPSQVLEASERFRPLRTSRKPS
jgi:endoribonuclease Dicer